MPGKDDKNQQDKRKDTTSLLSNILEDTRRDAELEMLQLQKRQQEKKAEEARRKAEEERRRREAYMRELEAEKRRRTQALRKFEDRTKQAEKAQAAAEQSTLVKQPERRFPLWLSISAGLVAGAAVAVAVFLLTRTTAPPVVFNPPMPDGAGKAVAYAMVDIPFGPATVKHENKLTVDQIILNTPPRVYVKRPRPKHVAHRSHRARHHKRRVKIRVKLFSPGSIIK